MAYAGSRNVSKDLNIYYWKQRRKESAIISADDYTI